MCLSLVESTFDFCSLLNTKHVGERVKIILINSCSCRVFKRVPWPHIMGNCIQKHGQGEFEVDRVKIGVGNQSRRQEEEDVECDHNGTKFGHNKTGMQRHMESGNDRMNDLHSLVPHNPSSSAFIEYQQKSLPLPRPNDPSSHTSHQNEPGLWPRPKPPKYAHKSEGSNSSKLQERLSSISLSTAYMLPMPASESEILSLPYLKAFSLDVLKKATANFSDYSLLGEGGYGRVYKGWLDPETLDATRAGSGMPVAIKKLIASGFRGHNEWLSEVSYLGRIRHPNLVKLIGYYSHGNDRILVYEFLPGGSLEKHLFKRKFPTLSWATRVKVATGVARGLCFLHEAESPVIHRDLKTSNVLLDTDFNAKLSNFGLAKGGSIEPRQTHVSTRVMGTEGYCDPHYLTTGELSVKSNVYNFGVVLLELLSGRRVIDQTKHQDEKNLVNWVRTHITKNGKVVRIMDTKLEGKYCKKSAYIATNIALSCVNPDPEYRPSMAYILKILENLPSQKEAIDFR